MYSADERRERRRVSHRDAEAVAKRATEAAAPVVSDTDRKITTANDHISQLKEKLPNATPGDRARIERKIVMHTKSVDGWRDEQKLAARTKAFDNSREAKLARDAIDSCTLDSYPHAKPESIALVRELGNQTWTDPTQFNRAVFARLSELADENAAVEAAAAGDLEHQRLAADAAAAKAKVRAVEASHRAEGVRGDHA